MRQHRPRSARAVAGLAVVPLALVAGCGGSDDDGEDGSTGAPPDSGGLVVASPAFASGEPIPTEHTCDGEDVSPPLTVSGTPDDAEELAIVVRDRDAEGFVHWVAAELPPDTTTVEAGALPPRAVEYENGFGDVGWSGPCPPEGDHTYELTVYALDAPPEIGDDAESEAAAAAVETAPISASATIEGTYERAGS